LLFLLLLLLLLGLLLLLLGLMLCARAGTDHGLGQYFPDLFLVFSSQSRRLGNQTEEKQCLRDQPQTHLYSVAYFV